MSSSQPSQPPGNAAFVHLHVHGEHSKLDGLGRIRAIVEAAAADGQPAVALTDHGNMGGAWKFVQACREATVAGTDAPIKPVLGVEAYMALVPPDGYETPTGHRIEGWDDAQVRFARYAREGVDAETGTTKRVANNHLTLLAENESGWRNLCSLMNEAERSMYGKSLIDYALLKQHGHQRWDAATGQMVPCTPGESGIIVLSGCLGGPVASQVAAGDSQAAAEALDHLVACVGASNVYVEIMEHGLSAEGVDHIRELTRLADDAGVSIVATNDAHFVDCGDAGAHEAWLAMSQSKPGKPTRVHDQDRWTFNGEGYWLRTTAEMRALYQGKRWQEACDNTVRLAARVTAIDEDHPYGAIPYVPLRLPTFPVPDDVRRRHGTLTGGDVSRFATPSALYLHEKVREGAKDRYGSFTPELRDRLRFEEDVILSMGLSDYFLIVADVLEWARSDRGLPCAEYPEGKPEGKKPIRVGPGRGSAAGSAIAYALWITMVEPLANGLLFERFLDVERVGMPDIDVDFEVARRDEVYDYLAARYGAAYIARIGAFQRAKTKRAIKDAARYLDLDPVGLKLADLVPVHQGAPQSFAVLFEEVVDKETGELLPNPQGSEFRDLVSADEDAARIVELARSFEDVAAGESIHAAGVIIADEPLTTLLPMRLMRDKQGNQVGVPIAYFDGKDADAFGLLKLDALGLRNLDIVTACVDNIAVTSGEKVDPDLLPDPDTASDAKVQRAFGMLRAGKTGGVFQLESEGITDLCVGVAPTTFSDLSALVALYRPGPMGADMHTLYADRKNGRAQVDYSVYTPVAAEQRVIASVLGDTYGTVVYQEQLMSLAEVVAGFTPAEKNKLRKAFSKKIRALMDSLEELFLEQGQQEIVRPDGTVKIAFRRSTLEALWTTFDASASYLFNKAHSAAYGYLGYVTAYLKANYPTEYAAALLTVTKKDADRRKQTLDSLTDDGFEVLGPDINLSSVGTLPDKERTRAIRIGLSEIRDVGSNAEHVVAEREARGPFTSLADLVSRVRLPAGDQDKPPAAIGSTAVDGLIESGALDSLDPHRLGGLMISRAVSADPTVAIPPLRWSLLERVNRQRHRLGVVIGDHPLSIYAEQLKSEPSQVLHYGDGEDVDLSPPTVLIDEIPGDREGNVQVTAWLDSWSERVTRAGKRMANFTISGARGHLEGVVFPRTYESWVASGTVPAVGEFATVLGEIRRKTITVTTVDDTGAEVEEDRTVTEFIANRCIPREVGTESTASTPPGPVPVPDEHRSAFKQTVLGDALDLSEDTLERAYRRSKGSRPATKPVEAQTEETPAAGTDDEEEEDVTPTGAVINIGEYAGYKYIRLPFGQKMDGSGGRLASLRRGTNCDVEGRLERAEIQWIRNTFGSRVLNLITDVEEPLAMFKFSSLPGKDEFTLYVLRVPEQMIRDNRETVKSFLHLDYVRLKSATIDSVDANFIANHGDRVMWCPLAPDDFKPVATQARSGPGQGEDAHDSQAQD